MVDGDFLDGMVRTVLEIAELSFSGPGDRKMKGCFLPEFQAVVGSCWWDFFLENREKLGLGGLVHLASK
ncbi:hypothetical protein GCM10028791_29810 [Echinicola sediminis]